MTRRSEQQKEARKWTKNV